MRVFAIHPGKQHSYQLAIGLKKQNLLGAYITSVYNKPGSLTRHLLRFVNGDTYKKISGRRCDFLDDKEVRQYAEGRVILTLFFNRYPAIQKIAEWWNFMTESFFYKKVMKFVVKEKPDAIIIYNGYSNKHLEILKDCKIVKIMDMSIAKREYIRDILQREIDETGLDVIKKCHFSYFDEKMTFYDVKGCNDVDFFLVPSEFVRESLLQNGIKSEQIRKVPYGVNVNQFKPLNNKKYNGKLKLLFVGGVTYRKGIHRLLNVVKDMSNVEVFLAGTYDKDSQLYKDYENNVNIHYLGFVTREKLNSLYNTCEVFVLPSLCEGMAMVGLEAMSAGLPLLCTRYTGVNDVVIDGVNGFVYDVNNEKQLKTHIQWFVDNREKIKPMGIEARKTALGYSWDIYHDNVSKAIVDCINSTK